VNALDRKDFYKRVFFPEEFPIHREQYREKRADFPEDFPISREY